MNATERSSQSMHAAPGGSWLRPRIDNWPREVCRLLEQESVVVRVLLAELRGSGPREQGACLLVTEQRVVGTIGGGALEWHATQVAREMLLSSTGSSARLHKLVLARELGQCCGGVVQIWVERFTHVDLRVLKCAARAIREDVQAILQVRIDGGRVRRRLLRVSAAPSEERARLFDDSRPNVALAGDADDSMLLQERLGAKLPGLWIYGAGHVGQAIVRILEGLPLRVTWIDPRAELLPLDLSENVSIRCETAPVTTVSEALPGTRFLILTHDHALDYELVHAVLKREDYAWLGLIGSKSKSMRFRSRLRHAGVDARAIERLTCPIGVEGIDSKWPAAIAVAVTAQLLRSLPPAARSVMSLSRGTPCSDTCTHCGSRGCA